MEQGRRTVSRQNAYIACPDTHDAKEAVAFLICERCGGVDELASPDLSSTLQNLLAKEGFQANGKVLEITGCDGVASHSVGTHSPAGPHRSRLTAARRRIS